MSLGRGNLMGKVTRCKHSWSRSWWETVASQGQLWSQLYRFELEEKLRSKNFRTRMSPQSQNFTQIPRLFCFISLWMFMFSRRSAVASAFTALQCVEVLPCVRGYLEKQLCSGDVCEFHFFANHLIHSLPWYAREIEQRNVQRVTWGGSCGVVTSVPHYLWRSWRVPCAPYVTHLKICYSYIVYYLNEMWSPLWTTPRAVICMSELLHGWLVSRSSLP